MSIEFLYYSSNLPEHDIVGILVVETKLYGLVNNYPLRRKPVPYYPIDLFQNNNRRLRVYIRDAILQPVDITGCEVIFTVKLKRSDTTSVIQKSTSVSGEGEIGSPDEGECFFYIVPEDTEELTVGQYVWDVTLYKADGKIYTVADGVVNLLLPVYNIPTP